MACVPKCVAALPVNTIVIFEYGTSAAPVMQTWSCEVGGAGGAGSKGALFPFPVIRLTMPFS